MVQSLLGNAVVLIEAHFTEPVELDEYEKFRDLNNLVASARETFGSEDTDALTENSTMSFPLEAGNDNKYSLFDIHGFVNEIEQSEFGDNFETWAISVDTFRIEQSPLPNPFLERDIWMDVILTETATNVREITFPTGDKLRNAEYTVDKVSFPGTEPQPDNISQLEIKFGADRLFARNIEEIEDTINNVLDRSENRARIDDLLFWTPQPAMFGVNAN